MTDEIEVAAGLVFRQARLLITQRHAGDTLGGLWEFPGGKRHPPESYEDCLRRELREELGIEVDVGALVESVCHDYPDRRVRLHFYLCRWRQGEPRTLGCQAFAWVRPDELRRYAFPAADARLLQLLRASPAWWV